MNAEQAKYLQENDYLAVGNDYEWSVLLNEVFSSVWLRGHWDKDDLFMPPATELTDMGLFFFGRMLFARDGMGIDVSKDVALQLFKKCKSEFNGGADIKLLEFRMKEAIDSENFELADQLKAKIEKEKTKTRD